MLFNKNKSVLQQTGNLWIPKTLQSQARKAINSTPNVKTIKKGVTTAYLHSRT